MSWEAGCCNDADRGKDQANQSEMARYQQHDAGKIDGKAVARDEPHQPEDEAMAERQ